MFGRGSMEAEAGTSDHCFGHSLSTPESYKNCSTRFHFSGVELLMLSKGKDVNSAPQILGANLNLYYIHIHMWFVYF